VTAATPQRAAVLLAAGALFGTIGAMCGIGGGLFAVPLLHFAMGHELRRSVATALVMVCATAVSATFNEWLRPEPRLYGWLVLALVAGSLVGATAGFRLSNRIDPARLRQVFIVVLTLAGARLMISVFTGAEDLAGEPELTAWSVTLGVLAGFLGGFLSPLLGIGGGLVVVPALYFGLPTLGFGGARAASLAVAVVSSSRGLWLHARAGRVAWSHGLYLAAGALLGARAGVHLIHQPGWVNVGRALLAICLWAMAAKFWRGRSARISAR